MRMVIRHALLIGSLFVVASAARADQGGKVAVCHVPPGNPGNPQSLMVSGSALQAHLGHGDSLGACSICHANGGSCAINSDCCSNFCSTGTCEPACANNGAACTGGAECCSGFCSSSGACAPPCTPNAGACVSDAECCSGSCQAGQCAAPCGLTPNGGGCTLDSDCCSGLCNAVNTCVEQCALVGSLCESSSGCCDGRCQDGLCIDLNGCVDLNTWDDAPKPSCSPTNPCCSGGVPYGSCVYSDALELPRTICFESRCAAPGQACNVDDPDSPAYTPCCWGLACTNYTCQ